MGNLEQFEPFWDSWYITDELGEGGFGKVYKIERNEFGNTYYAALKHLRVPQSQSEVKSIMADGMDERSVEKYFESMVGDIIGEFVLMSKLKGHSHIVSYEDHKVIKADNQISWDIFIRMELLTNLLDYIRSKDITKRDVIKLGIDMCKALELCQKYNIIHRDVKPENIFVSDSGDYKLGDFGIARQAEKTMSGMSKKGTFTYIAPEVYKGEAYGSSVDIYSLGIVMYRLLNNNRVPFMPPYPKPITHADRELALVKRVSGQPIPKPINAEGRLAEIVLKACAYSPKDRYSSPLQMRQELEAILYSDAEGKIIYPEGDKADIKSLKYIGTGKEGVATKKTTSKNDDESTRALEESEADDTRTIGSISADFDSTADIKNYNEQIKKRKNKTPLIIGGVAGATLIACGGILIGSNIKNKTGTEETTIDFQALREQMATEIVTEKKAESMKQATTAEAETIEPTTDDKLSAESDSAAKAEQEAAAKAQQEAAAKAQQEAAAKAQQEAAAKAQQEAAAKAQQEAAAKAQQEAAAKAQQEAAAKAAAEEAARQAAAEEAAKQAAEAAARQKENDNSVSDEIPEFFIGWDD